MKYQIGDTVLLLHSNEEGQVVDIINDKMLMIDVKGVSFPVYMDQVDFPYFKRFTEKKMFPVKKEKQFIDDLRKEKLSKETREENGVWLTFLPVMKLDEFGDVYVEELKVHLVSHSNTQYNFSYNLQFFGKTDFNLKNTLHTFEDFYLHDVDFEALNDSPAFGFDFSLTEPDKKKADHFEANIKIKPKQLFARIEELKKNNEATFSYQLIVTYPDKVIEDRPELGKLASKGYKIFDASKGRQHLEAARSVVDLHIEKLIDSHKHMSNFQILSLQLQTFEKYYDLALAHRLQSFIVIHGVGEGVLKNEIHQALNLKSEVKSFVNQYDARFGFGATEIFLK